MKKYKYAIIRKFAFHDFYIKCTDINSLDDILANLQKVSPDFQFRPYEEDLTEEPYNILIEQKGKEKFEQREIEWWLIKQLCNSGWRPLGEGRYVYEEDY